MKRDYLSKFLYLGIFAITFFACNSGSNNNEENNEGDTPSAFVGATSGGLSIQPTLPAGPAAGSDQKTLAEFAWNEFFALNWASSFPKDKKRDNPDTNWKFNSTDYPGLAVWETYIHRRELQLGVFPLPDLSTGMPRYDYGDNVDTSPNGVDPSKFWINLDEDNEIGSCYIVAYDSLEVLYMAKSNLAEYNYVRDNFKDSKSLKTAISNGTNLDSLVKWSKSASTYCSKDETDYVCLPCADDTNQGAVEIKTAWRFLVEGKDDPSRFITREVVYYKREKIKGKKKLVTKRGTMGLIGMHIIRKTENYPAFIFASFEQVDVQNKYNPSAADQPLEEEQNIHTYYSAKTNVFDPPGGPHNVVPRAISSTIQGVNASALSMITTSNKSSLLQYYRLIGVQGTPVDYPNRASDENYFMANYVIESDSMLTRFHGSFGDPFNDTITNVIYDQKMLTMGGCQGCHGRAQLIGTDFSFIFPSGKSGSEDPDPFQTIEEIRIETARKTVSFMKSMKSK